MNSQLTQTRSHAAPSGEASARLRVARQGNGVAGGFIPESRNVVGHIVYRGESSS